MKTFKQHLRELTLKFRPVDEFEVRQAEKFQYVMKTFAAFQRVSVKSEEHVFDNYELLKKKLNPYMQEPWMLAAIRYFGRKDKEIVKFKTSKQKVDSHDPSSIYSDGIAAMGDWKKFVQFGKSVGDYANSKRTVDDGNRIFLPAKHLNNPFYKENGLIFGSRGFLSQIEAGDIDDVVNADLSNAFTGIDFPFESEDFEHVVFWFQKLRNQDGQEEVKTHDFKKVMTMRNIGNEDFATLTELVSKYLRHNDKKSLTAAVEMIEQFPDIKERSDQLKRKISTVYRGIRGSNIDEDEIREREKQNGIVAATDSIHVAMRFVAHGGAHLVVPKETTSGYMLTYDVDPEDIFLDTAIFGSVFGEREIVINTKSAEISNIQFFQGTAEDDDDEDF